MRAMVQPSQAQGHVDTMSALNHIMDPRTTPLSNYFPLRANPLRINELAPLGHLTASTLILYIETNGYYMAADRQVVSDT